MARSTWGNRRKRGNAWQLKYPVAGKMRYETFYGSAKDADKRLAELRVIYENAASSLTVRQFWERYYHPEIEEHLSETTVNGYEQKYEHDIRPVFGDVLMDEVRPRAVQEWLMTMPPATARHAKAVFSAMFSRAFAMDIVDDNPLQRRYIMPKGDTSRKRDDGVFSEPELLQIEANCKGEPWEAAFLLSAFGGASRYEAMGVQAKDVSKRDGYAVVKLARGVHRVGRDVIVRDELKNEFRAREIVLEPIHAARLFELASLAQAESDASGFEHAWLTGDGFGNVLCPNVMAQGFRRWFCDQPLKYHPFGNLRNSYATMMLSRGVDGSMVAKMLGNEERSTTEKHYERPSADDFIHILNGAYVR